MAIYFSYATASHRMMTALFVGLMTAAGLLSLIGLAGLTVGRGDFWSAFATASFGLSFLLSTVVAHAWLARQGTQRQ